MATDPINTTSLTQNPAPFPERGQDFITKVRAQTDLILAQFMRVLPSNYVSQVTGPFYTMQFQAAAEQLATFQITAQEVFKDSDYSFTRPEFLWEVLGTMVFPGSQNVPDINGDQTYREFLKKMVLLLLQGATPASVESGTELLTEADVLLLERFLEARVPGSEFTIDDQFFFDLLIDNDNSFPPEPFKLQANTRLILEALKPAHTLYTYSFLFRETFGPLFDDSMSWELSNYYYDDFRRFWAGAKEITGTAGVILSGRTLFSDATRSFESVQVGGLLRIASGANAGAYRVSEVLSFPAMNDSTARAYTTSPTGLSGTLTIASGIVTDTAQDFGACVEGEILTIAAGPNIGSYRIQTLLGTNGGPVGVATGPATQVRVSPSILRLETRIPTVVTGQVYAVDVDRLGVKVPKTILGEDVSEQFYL